MWELNRGYVRNSPLGRDDSPGSILGTSWDPHSSSSNTLPTYRSGKCRRIKRDWLWRGSVAQDWFDKLADADLNIDQFEQTEE